MHQDFIRILVDEIDLPIIVDAGIGRPSQACEAMEMGVAAIMCNTAVATAGDVALMAKAFKLAIEAGRAAYLAGPDASVERQAEASSPLTGFLGINHGNQSVESDWNIWMAWKPSNPILWTRF
jgi:thiazole synthase